MSAQKSAGIQTLLEAERESQKIIQQAREYRTKRVKDAKSEAQKEIEDYRKQKEQEYQKYEQEQTGGNKQAEADADKDTEAKLKEIEGIAKSAGPQVVEDILRAVTVVKPEVPDRS